MGKKQKKKATEKEISQKTCAAENKEDKSGMKERMEMLNGQTDKY